MSNHTPPSAHMLYFFKSQNCSNCNIQQFVHMQQRRINAMHSTKQSSHLQGIDTNGQQHRQ